ICTEPIEYTDDLDQEESVPQGEKYQKYKTDYKPVAHEYRVDDEENKVIHTILRTTTRLSVRF
ncbi:MAG: hypothetical protein P4L59_00445, partial [Desulfosporosinus sp.]|nr:hypothetical protein [Desulfosporosinus sp.]